MRHLDRHVAGLAMSLPGYDLEEGLMENDSQSDCSEVTGTRRRRSPAYHGDYRSILSCLGRYSVSSCLPTRGPPLKRISVHHTGSTWAELCREGFWLDPFVALVD